MLTPNQRGNEWKKPKSKMAERCIFSKKENMDSQRYISWLDQ
jgi:hypothetical protein